jgi:hypothetical protein
MLLARSSAAGGNSQIGRGRDDFANGDRLALSGQRAERDERLAGRNTDPRLQAVTLLD